MHLLEAKPLHFCAELIAKLCKLYFLMSLAFQKGITCQNPTSGSGLKKYFVRQVKKYAFCCFSMDENPRTAGLKIRGAILAPI